jgi:hypothetical protein
MIRRKRRVRKLQTAKESILLGLPKWIASCQGRLSSNLKHINQPCRGSSIYCEKCVAKKLLRRTTWLPQLASILRPQSQVI